MDPNAQVHGETPKAMFLNLCIKHIKGGRAEIGEGDPTHPPFYRLIIDSQYLNVTCIEIES